MWRLLGRYGLMIAILELAGAFLVMLFLPMMDGREPKPGLLAGIALVLAAVLAVATYVDKRKWLEDPKPSSDEVVRALTGLDEKLARLATQRGIAWPSTIPPSTESSKIVERVCHIGEALDLSVRDMFMMTIGTRVAVEVAMAAAVEAPQLVCGLRIPQPGNN